MVLLQNKLNLKVSQRQILTPGLVQMVSVLALNKLELKEMITNEMVENPVLEELELSIPSVEEVARKDEEREREREGADEQAGDKSDPFEEIDFGSFFRDYLDPGHRTHYDMESLERPSFENFLSKPTTLTDHLIWQLGSLQLRRALRDAAELIIGNLNEDGYLSTSLEDLQAEVDAEPNSDPHASTVEATQVLNGGHPESRNGLHILDDAEIAQLKNSAPPLRFSPQILQEALEVVQSLDPPGVAARDLRECLMLQLQHLELTTKHGDAADTLADALAIADTHLHAVQNKQHKEIAKALGKTVEDVQAAIDLIRTLDPKPGARYNVQESRLIEPDVAFVKQGDQWFVLMNEDDLPQLRLNPGYKKLMQKDAAERDVRNYVKERYKSAIQLIKNIEQRKQTILKVCHSIIERQRDFLEHGIDQLKPMMIKEVAEEIGVHPSTVSRAVANKYVHTQQGVFELRYFFSESVNGPEGGGTSLLILKRRVKKIIEEEDPKRPLTDEQITRILQSQGIQVTRRTVAKYREDMKIPSTHQRRVKD
jgi:RNA polymerase sigma-54 factor